MYITNAIETINRRYSCRSYTGQVLSPVDQSNMLQAIQTAPNAPFDSSLRFVLIAGQDGDSTSLKGLGTYGMLKGVPAYLAGVVKSGPNAMEDFGYVVEHLVLAATAMKLGTCWLGGTFTKSRFAQRVGLQRDEVLAAIIAIGYPAAKPLLRERLTRTAAGSDHRLPWESMFYEDDFTRPLPIELPEAWSTALQAVRRGPSASNKQPWRIVKANENWHFYVHRSPSYRRMLKTAGLVDLQRNDVGIAMCHFELVLHEHGIFGEWQTMDIHPSPNDQMIEYVASWQAKS